MSNNNDKPASNESILDKIAAHCREAIPELEAKVSRESLLSNIATLDKELGGPKSLYDRLSIKGDEVAVAAEFKRASPSKGDIAVHLVAGDQAVKYAKAGASVISVLTEPKWFKGSLNDMLEVRRTVQTSLGEDRPLVLRKDFVIDEYMLLEARAHGADTVLLIVAILSIDELESLLRASRKLGMEPLVEVANESEMRTALKVGAKVVGVNNRNLHTFKVDMTTTTRMVDVSRTVAQETGVDPGVLIVALSGVRNRDDVIAYERHGGVCGILVGETLMLAPNPEKMIHDLVRGAQAAPTVQVKICGITNPEDALVAARAGANFIGVIFAPVSKRKATIEQARQVVDAIQKFRERDGVVQIQKPSDTGDSASSWFTNWGEQLRIAAESRGRPLVVGVFMNQSTEEVQKIVDETGVDMIQLHGSEGFEGAAAFKLPVIRVMHVEVDEAGEAALDSKAMSDNLASKIQVGSAVSILLDTSIKGGASGGTGKTFDWSVGKHVQDLGVPVIMAGGLTPDNVADAVATASPWGVDVASGVEASIGIKDHDKVRQFVKRAKGIVE